MEGCPGWTRRGVQGLLLGVCTPFTDAGAAQQRAPRPAPGLCCPAVPRPGLGPVQPGPGGGRSRSPAGVEWEFGPGKAAAEIYDAGGQSVKAVYHPQVGLKERKHIFNKKRGFAIQLRC